MLLPIIPLASSLLIAVACLPLVLRKVPRNGFYGMRTPRTMNGSEEVWLHINQRVGRIMMIAAILSAFADIALCFVPIPESARLAIAMLLMLAAVLLPVVVCRKLLF